MERAVQSLMDMGIPEDVAKNALNKAGGNIEAAASYIFSNELPDEINQPIRENVKDSSFIGKGEHVELASSANGFNKGDLSNIIATTRTEQIIDTDSDDSDVQFESSPPNTSDDKLSIHKFEIDDSTIVLPLPPNFLFENYFALFSLFVVNYLPQYLFRPDFKDLNYDKNWFKGISVNKPLLKLDFNEEQELIPTAKSEDSNIMQPELLWQLQKFGSIVNSTISDRAFVRSKMFAIALDSQIQRKLGEAEHLYEILPAFIKSLAIDLEMCPDFDTNEIKNLFISSAFHTPSVDESTKQTWLSLFHFLPEEYDSNLYRMFNALLHPDESINLEINHENDSEAEKNENSLDVIAPILTIVFDEMDESTEHVNLTEGVEVPLKFYPQLYTKKCKDELIRPILEKRKQAQLLSRSILQDITNLKSFQGKDILKFLNSTIDYLQLDNKDSDLINQLLLLKDEILSRKTTRTNEYKHLAQQLQTEWNLSHPEISLVNTAKDRGLIDEPYILTLAAISPYNYFSRDRSGTWHYVHCNMAGSDFKVRTCSSELEVQDSIKQCTKQASESPLMFIYCKEHFIPQIDQVNRALEMNEGCLNFAKLDQLELNKSHQKHQHEEYAHDYSA
ncbi:hypothetical protein HG535_0D04260 [Zygotorulaspora mrakii]|uniref:UBA domain-containing protein n=1 Tax=Zygotorulaspora mrakii TaxID=42260 RepID=A0A7H9B240_ZYGMR|nr:uncharacterized protein HG535_0D04260 [Zygotorulaspora mrakii]QLG72718.1 hypothetical protein HG535_0D04260 [Zygotorulaspora mrakii]